MLCVAFVSCSKSSTVCVGFRNDAFLAKVDVYVHIQVVLGGGQEAREVTKTTTKAGKFDARFYLMIYKEEIGGVKGHFGPINSLKFHPEGKRWALIRVPLCNRCCMHSVGRAYSDRL